MSYDNTNRGSISKNLHKQKDNQADIAGSINVEGVEYWINGWLKEGRNGKFYSLSVKPKQERAQEILDNHSHSSGYDPDIPF